MRSVDDSAPAEPVEVAPGIYQLAVPTPFAVGTVNAYLIAGEPLTLVDGGPNLATSLAELERLVRAAGYEIADLELLLITHQHVDHEGLTGLLAERSGAEVACGELVAAYVGDVVASQRADDRFAQALMRRHGIDGRVVDALGSVASILAGLGAAVTVTRRLQHGALVAAGGRMLRALHRPGHSTGDTVFHDEDAGVIFSGDHLLSKISSNALVTRATAGGEAGRTRPLLEYRRSLIATGELEAELTLGGHGPSITDHRALVEQRLENQIRKAERLRGLLAERPLSAHELATSLYGDVAFTQAFLTLSEVLGHLDLLIAEGLVVADEQADPVRFCAI